MDVILVTFKPDGERIAIQIVKPVTVIGRGMDCDLELPLSGISRRHCQIRIHENRIEVTDLSSSNGTYVNGVQVMTSNLAGGDRLRIGIATFTVQIDGVPQEILPAQVPLQKRSRRKATRGPSRAGNQEAVTETGALARLARLHEDERDEESVDALDALDAMSKRRKRKTQ